MRIVKAKKIDVKKCVEIKATETLADKRLIRKNLLTAINDKDHFFLVAKLRDKIVGYINGNFDDWNNSIFIQELFLDSLYRGRGIGTRLINRVKEIGIAQGRRIILLDVPPNNKRAIKFYKKNGFCVAGEIRGLYKTHSKAIILSISL